MRVNLDSPIPPPHYRHPTYMRMYMCMWMYGYRTGSVTPASLSLTRLIRSLCVWGGTVPVGRQMCV
jgi:hypothetical protein